MANRGLVRGVWRALRGKEVRGGVGNKSEQRCKSELARVGCREGVQAAQAGSGGGRGGRGRGGGRRGPTKEESYAAQCRV